MSQINVLYYSNHCEGSRMLISLMESEKLIRFFKTICTDNNPMIPLEIKKTPTLIIRNVPTPYVAADAFGWFSKIKQWKINMMMRAASNAQQKYLQNINTNLATTESNILGFSQAEMSGMSDMFSFFSENQNKECQEAFPQSFVICDNIGKDAIFTPPEIKDEKRKISAIKHKELQDSIKAERDKQDSLIKQHIDAFKNQYKG